MSESEYFSPYLKKMTFGELNPPDKFIAFPVDGDNEGHGGYTGKHWIFRKVDKWEAVMEKYGTLSKFPADMPVIQVE